MSQQSWKKRNEDYIVSIVSSFLHVELIQLNATLQRYNEYFDDYGRKHQHGRLNRSHMGEELDPIS